MKKALGVLLILLGLAPVIGGMIYRHDLLIAMAICGAAVVITAVIAYGLWLIVGD